MGNGLTKGWVVRYVLKYGGAKLEVKRRCSLDEMKAHVDKQEIGWWVQYVNDEGRTIRRFLPIENVSYVEFWEQ